jgi:hypothetical protein
MTAFPGFHSTSSHALQPSRQNARRLHGIAISPALIMVLVGSLAFFLLEFLPRLEGRLNWIMGCFVFAAVLIARISMEEGAERASFCACWRWRSAWRIASSISAVGWLVLAIIWFCAHELTWNCTLIDEAADASGEGLLQAAGLDDEAALQALPATQPRTRTQSPFRRVFNWFANRRQRNAHQGAVVYFSLAAAVFGLGNAAATVDLGKRRYLWRVLLRGQRIGPVADDSFLGLRRYAAAQLPMPPNGGCGWPSARDDRGDAGVAAIVPRPNPEYAISACRGDAPI